MCVTPLSQKSRFRVLAIRLAPLNYIGLSAQLRSLREGIDPFFCCEFGLPSWWDVGLAI